MTSLIVPFLLKNDMIPGPEGTKAQSIHFWNGPGRPVG